MKSPALSALGILALASIATAEPDRNWLEHDRARPQPPVVDPGSASTANEPGRPPSDAVVLFNGSDTSQWVAMDGSPTKWLVHERAFECVPSSGFARTLECFGDCQLHVEWATPNPAHGSSQDRGNSGVFFGFDRYECQVLDSYQNKTYADGSAAAVYGQYPPLVNVSRPPGEWQTYDIVWTAPRFALDGHLISQARETVFHNGVLVQNNVELTGPTSWLQRAPYAAHPERTPIALQDHGNPVRYRNIWVRELGHYSHKEFRLPDSVLETYVGDYPRTPSNVIHVARAPDGLLKMSFGGTEFLMHAESPTHFFAITNDVQCDFTDTDGRKAVSFTVGDWIAR